MSTTPYLGIPLVAESQAQPEITHNEALLMLQALLGGVVSVGINAPPGSPQPGQVWVVGVTPTGAWAGRANAVALWTAGGWRFVPGRDDDGTPIAMSAAQEGLSVYSRSADARFTWSGSAWVRDTPRRVAVPAGASSAGAVGDVAWDASYAYFCTATDTWVRAAVASW